MAKILIVDDEPNIIKTMSSILQDENHIVYPASNAAEALAFLSANDIDIAFFDVWLPDMDGLNLLEIVKTKNSEIEIIMISGHASIDVAVKSTKIGAFDFLEKPLSMERILTVVMNAVRSTNLKRENKSLKLAFDAEDEMIGNSKAINEVRDVIDRAASTNARVFITGSNGTGKELVAKAIYKKSKRYNKPFIKVNCAAIPDELIESELFGHEKGAFTGAVAKRAGKFELANGGTLFLDEICDMSLSAQAKVLRVLQEEELERVGGNETIGVDIRIIAATNVNVRKAIENGQFREDLYFRLNVIPIEVPSLSDRKSDIPVIVDYYLRKFSKLHGIGHKEIDNDGMEFLINYPWPGNIRELRNIIERVSIMVPREIISGEDLEKYLEMNFSYQETYISDKSNLKIAKEEFEKNFIINMINQKKGNISQAAKELGIERTNLHRKIKQYNIDTSSFSG
ncbi:MAG: sigma-54-dependent Fis family transcriptional regulator [Spirochaetes bacterium]|nr:sigma-54-dependent Fis family transcriptional regulator [Spirochaetota bacterium]